MSPPTPFNTGTVSVRARAMLPGNDFYQVLEARRSDLQLTAPVHSPKLAFTALHQAVLDARCNQVRLLVTKTPDGADCRDLQGRTPLMLCALVANERAGVQMAKVLLDLDPFLGWQDKEGRTALTYAVLCGREALAQLFLRREPRRVLDPDHHGDLPIHHAARCGSLPLLAMLLHASWALKEPLSSRSGSGFTPLLLACMHGHARCALLLLDKGRASPADRDPQFGRTALQWFERPRRPSRARPEALSQQQWSNMTLSYDKRATLAGGPGHPVCPVPCEQDPAVEQLSALSDEEARGQLIQRLRSAPGPAQPKRTTRLQTPALEALRDKDQPYHMALLFQAASASLNAPCPARPDVPKISINDTSPRGPVQLAAVLSAAERFKKIKKK